GTPEDLLLREPARHFPGGGPRRPPARRGCRPRRRPPPGPVAGRSLGPHLGPAAPCRRRERRIQAQFHGNRWNQGSAWPLSNDLYKPERVDAGVLPEPYDDGLPFAVDGLDAQAVRGHPDAAVLGEIQDRWRQGAVAVPDLIHHP